MGLTAMPTFSGALAWPFVYPWPQRPAGLIDTAFDELARRWRPLLDAADEAGVDMCYEIHPGEDLFDGTTFEMFLERVDGHPRCNMIYDPSHYVLQALDYLDNIDIYHDRIKLFHVKDAELNPTGRQGVYSGYASWVNRAGRFRSPGDGQVDFGAVFSKLAAYDFDGWAVVEWECALKHPEDGAREGAEFVKHHIIRVTEKAFDDFAAGGSDEAANRLHPRAGLTGGQGEKKTMSDAKPARIRLGMVGGGKDAFIGAVHRIAARIDDQFELVAGALSATPEKARESGRALGLAEDRTYDDFATMAKREARRKNGVEAVAIVTPNHMHAPAAREFLKRGIHVICDKPLTATLPEARRLAKIAAESDALFILTHNYTGYPMIRQARAMVADGTLGKLRVVQVEYAQDWLATPLEETGQKQAGWRTDPARTGKGGSTGDIGTHAFNLAGFVTGLRLEALAADLQAFVPGRRVDDNGNVLLRYEGGARGMLWCSQVAVGSRERAQAARLRRQGRARVGAGGSELPLAHAARRAEAAADPRRGRRRARGGAGQSDAVGASRGLSRGLRQHLRRGGPGDPRAARGPAGAGGRGVSDDRGRGRRRRLRRRLRALVGAQRRLGQPLTFAATGWWLSRGTKRSGTSLDGGRSTSAGASGSSASRCSASATPTASRSASKCDRAGSSPRAPITGKMQITETSGPTRRPRRANSS